MGRGRSLARHARRGARPLGARWPGLLNVLLIGIAAAFFAATAATAAARPRPDLAAPGRYGPDLGRVQAAMRESQWPQARSNWCGVATIAAIARYDGVHATQESVAATLDSLGATSLWGTPAANPSAPDPGFHANISRDLGTDPRSLAAGLSIALGAPYRQVVALGDAREATAHLAADVVATGEPISVIVDHGQHSAIISGVYADTKPGDGVDVTALEVWDPGVDSPFGQIQPAAMAVVPLEVWLSDPSYWGAPYETNYIPSVGFEFDPDPDVGPYAVQGQAHLWIGHYVYLKRMAAGTPPALAGPDWAFDETGALISGTHGETPPAYTGQVIGMPGTQPSAAPPTTAPRAAATAAPSPGVASRPAARVSAWRARDFAQPWCRAGWCQPFASLPLLAVGPAAGGSAALMTALLTVGAHGVGAARRRRRARRDDAPAPLPILPVYGRVATPPDTGDEARVGMAGEATGRYAGNTRVEYVESEEIVEMGTIPHEDHAERVE